MNDERHVNPFAYEKCTPKIYLYTLAHQIELSFPLIL